MTDAAKSASRLIDSREQETLCDDVMDWVQAEISGRGSVAFRPAEELERERREERMFLEAMAKGLRETLANHGIRILKIAADGVGDGYVIYAQDNQGRPYTVNALYDDMMPRIVALQENRARACINYVTELILKARQKYFERRDAR